MAIQTINIGTVPNDGTGDRLRDAFDKVNSNFADLDTTKQDDLILTTTGTSGAATLIGDTLNIPQYSGGSGLQHATASGTDTYTVTISGVASYADGDAYLIRFTNGNTTSCTLNINSLGAIALYRNNDGQLIGGDIINNGEMLCVYNSALNIFQAIGTSPNMLLTYATNEESITITKGQPVYVSGGTGDRVKVKLAYNTSDNTSAQTIGLVLSASIAANQKGLILMQGQLDGLNLFPTPTWADGDFVYLGSTPGTLTNVKPYAPNHLVYLGYVTTASNGSAGRMYVKVQNGYELDELHNVSAQTPSNKDGLFYNTSTSLWEARQVSATDIDANVSNTEFSYLDGVTSAIQTQINAKQGSLTLTTTGTSGASTLVGNTLNIPQYSGGSGGANGIHTFLKPPSGQSTTVGLLGGAFAGAATIATRIYLTPYIPAQDITCSSLQINVTTAVASSNARILIYSDLDGIPDTKLYESANLDCSTTGVKTATTTQTFTAGTTYWIGLHSSSTQAFTSIPVAQLLVMSHSIGSNTFTSYIANVTFGSAPATWTSTSRNNQPAPAIYITI